MKVLHRWVIQLDKGMKFSMNQVWGGSIHWAKRASITRGYHSKLGKLLGAKRTMVVHGKKSHEKWLNGRVKVDCMVDLTFNWKWKSRPLDSGNCQGMSKALEDTLTMAGFWPDDNNKYVRRVTNESVLLTEDERDALECDEVEMLVTKAQ